MEVLTLGGQKIDRYMAETAKREKREAEKRREDLRAKRQVGSRPFKLHKEELAKMVENAIAWTKDTSLLATFIEQQAVVMLQVDALLGTDPSRLRGIGGTAVSAQCRARFMENAGRLLADLRGNKPKELSSGILDGVIAETAISK